MFAPSKDHPFAAVASDAAYPHLQSITTKSSDFCLDASIPRPQGDQHTSTAMATKNPQAKEKNAAQTQGQRNFDNDKNHVTGHTIFLDSADLGAIKAAYATGLIDGVTTNPSLVKTMGASSLQALCRPILDLGMPAVSIEVTAEDAEGMIQQGKLFYSWGPGAVVKIPMTRQGLIACRELANQSIPVNVTLCFSISQVVLAAKAGARYISVFLGRLEDQGISGKNLSQMIDGMHAALLAYGTHPQAPQLLLASVRSLSHVTEAFSKGQTRAITMPPKIFDQMFDHILTERGLSTFAKDGQTIPIACQA
jgi:transaldolase